MKKIQFKNAEFVKSAVFQKDYPILRDKGGALLNEIAVVGRSNVGKSSLLNHLFRAKSLVKTSSTPGKTRLLNFFKMNEELAFADLPGYGFAKGNAQALSGEESLEWSEMIETYFKERQTLKLVLLLLDIRRVPSLTDAKMIDWLIAYQIPFITVLTKVDKVSIGEKMRQTQAIQEALGLVEPLVHYSTLKNEGRDALIFHICKFLEEDSCPI